VLLFKPAGKLNTGDEWVQRTVSRKSSPSDRRILEPLTLDCHAGRETELRWRGK
jgi:hypothetical protein